MTDLEKLSADELERQRAEIREKALKDEATFLDDAKKEGIEQGIKLTAKTLLAMKILSSEQISEATGLSLEEIEILQASLA